MTVFSFTKLRNVVLAAVVLAGAGVAASVLPANAEQPDQAAEMLQDGLDALSDSQSDLAKELFEQVIQTYPGSEESERALRELTALGVRPAARVPEPGSAFVRRTPESEAALRMVFAKEAGDRVFFAENSAIIGGRARALIETQARWLARRSELRVTIVGRADDGASPDVSRELSTKRAEAVRDKLVASGVAPTRITIDGRGALDPVATCRSQLCQAQNRHAETLLTTGVVSGGQVGEAERGILSGQRTRGATAGGGVSGGETVSR